MIKLDQNEIAETLRHARFTMPMVKSVSIDSDKENVIFAVGTVQNGLFWNATYLRRCVEEVAMLLVMKSFPAAGRQWTFVIGGEAIWRNIPELPIGRLSVYVDLTGRESIFFFLNGRMEDAYGRLVLEIRNIEII